MPRTRSLGASPVRRRRAAAPERTYQPSRDGRRRRASATETLSSPSPPSTSAGFFGCALGWSLDPLVFGNAADEDAQRAPPLLLVGFPRRRRRRDAAAVASCRTSWSALERVHGRGGALALRAQLGLRLARLALHALSARDVAPAAQANIRGGRSRRAGNRLCAVAAAPASRAAAAAASAASRRLAQPLGVAPRGCSLGAPRARPRRAPSRRPPRPRSAASSASRWRLGWRVSVSASSARSSPLLAPWLASASARTRRASRLRPWRRRRARARARRETSPWPRGRLNVEHRGAALALLLEARLRILLLEGARVGALRRLRKPRAAQTRRPAPPRAPPRAARTPPPRRAPTPRRRRPSPPPPRAPAWAASATREAARLRRGETPGHPQTRQPAAGAPRRYILRSLVSSRTAASARASLSTARASASSLHAMTSRARGALQVLQRPVHRFVVLAERRAPPWPARQPTSIATLASAAAAPPRGAPPWPPRGGPTPNSRARRRRSSANAASGLGSSGRISAIPLRVRRRAGRTRPRRSLLDAVCPVCGSSRLDAPNAAEDGASPSPSGASRLAAYEPFATVAEHVGRRGRRAAASRKRVAADDAPWATRRTDHARRRAAPGGAGDATPPVNLGGSRDDDARDDSRISASATLDAASARVGSRSSRLLLAPVATAAFSSREAATQASSAEPSGVGDELASMRSRVSVANSLNPSFKGARHARRRAGAERVCVDGDARGTPPLKSAALDELDAEVPGNQGAGDGSPLAPVRRTTWPPLPRAFALGIDDLRGDLRLHDQDRAPGVCWVVGGGDAPDQQVSAVLADGARSPMRDEAGFGGKSGGAPTPGRVMIAARIVGCGGGRRYRGTRSSSNSGDRLVARDLRARRPRAESLDDSFDQLGTRDDGPRGRPWARALPAPRARFESGEAGSASVPPSRPASVGTRGWPPFHAPVASTTHEVPRGGAMRSSTSNARRRRTPSRFESP